MKRMLALLLVCSFFLFGCQNAIGVNQDGGIPVTGPYDELLKGSTETKTPFLPVANEYFETEIFQVNLMSENEITAFGIQTSTSISVEQQNPSQTPTYPGRNATPSSAGFYLPTATENIPATSTPIEEQINLTDEALKVRLISITATEPGKALVVWSMIADFEGKFRVSWTKSSDAPIYPGNDYVETRDSTARSKIISGTPGETIYVTVGKYIGKSCCMYGNTMAFTFPEEILTATPIIIDTPIPPTASPVPPSDTSIPTLVDTETPIVVEATAETTPEEGGE